MLFGKNIVKLFIKYIGKNDYKRYLKQQNINPCNMKKDIPYLDDSNRFHLFDIYYPEISNNKVILDIHGGGYIYGTKEINYGYCMNFVKSGFTVINLNYRLLDDELTVVDQVKDIFSCINYIVDNSRELELNFDSLSLLGDSAGGHLALLTTLAFSSEDLQSKLEVSSPNNMYIERLCLSSPVFSIKTILASSLKILNQSGVKYVFSNKYNDVEYLKLIDCGEALKTITPPPIYVSSAKNDFLLQESIDLTNILKKYGHPVYYDYTDSKKRKIAHVYNLVVMESPEAIRTNELQVKFMRGELDAEIAPIVTSQVRLRKIQMDDLDDFYEYASVDGIGERAGWSHHKSKEESLEILKRFVHEDNTYAIIDKAKNKMIGSIGLHENDDPNYKNQKVITMGYVLSKDYWGRGIMTEAVTKLIDYLFKYKGIDVILISHNVQNKASQRVIEKCGFIYQYTEIKNLPSCWSSDQHYVYSIINPNLKDKD